MKQLIFALSFSVAGIAACSSTDTTNAGTPPGDGGVDSATAACKSTHRGTTPKPNGAGDSGGSLEHIDRSGLTNVGVDPAPLDYTNANLWLCRPGIDANECYGDLDATAFYPDGTSEVLTHVRAADPAFDCFYVYPTVNLTGTGNTTDLSDISHVQDALLSQGARFSRICEVYAPLYRQLAIGTAGASTGDGGSVSLNGDSNIAYGDVKAAFNQYLSTWNKGRKFVLIGHSQGTLMLQRLMTEMFDVDSGADLRARMISALLVGGGPSVPENEAVGGTFRNIPACTAAAQTGCIVAYNSYAKEAPPPDNALFGRSNGGNEIVCTSPLVLARNGGLSKGSYVPKKLNTPAFVPNAPGGTVPPFDTPYAVFPDVFHGECVRESGFHYFQVSVGTPACDQRSVAPYRNTLTEGIGFGLHVVDFNLFLDDLIEGVKLQADAALK